jgi:quinolinate synthase
MKKIFNEKFLGSVENKVATLNSNVNNLSAKEKQTCIANIKTLLKKRDAVLVAHFYTDADIQKIADETGGIVADSLEMARFGARHSAKTLLVAGVRFMGETAKILSPHKKVIMPNLDADCSLALSCQPEEFNKFCLKHPERTKVVYVNTSASIKALADWTVTSSIAVKIIEYLTTKNKKLIWAPDKYLGNYLKTLTKADMLIWSGSCVVHEKFKANGIKKLKKLYPNAAVLVHPESPDTVVSLADAVGSTSQLLAASQKLSNKVFIVATDSGILYKMREKSPNKTFLSAPTAGKGATCISCAHCPWMAMNTILNLEDVLKNPEINNIELDEKIMHDARLPLQRMLDFAEGKYD